MAWIKIFQTLVNHPKLFKLAEILKKDIHQTCGLLVFLWTWALDYADDGDLSKFTEIQIYNALRTNSELTPNLIQSLIDAGFLNKDKTIHDWHDYAGEFLKGRYKKKKKLPSKNITTPEQLQSNSRVTHGKSRVEYSIVDKSKVKKSRFIKPTIKEIKEYCKERNNSVDADRFVNYYDSNGWRVGKNPMKDWRAAVRTWERQNFNNKKNIGDDYAKPKPGKFAGLENRD